MESSTQGNVSIQQATTSGEVILPVSVGDGVDQVVFNLGDGLMADDQTTYIIQFVDNTSSATTEVSTVQQDVTDRSIVLESKTDETASDIVIQQPGPEPSASSQTVFEAIQEEKLEKEVTIEEQNKSYLKALNLGHVGVVKSKQPDEQDTGKSVTLQDKDSSDKGTDKNVLSTRKTNRRNIKKPKRFADVADLGSKKQKEPIYIKLPKITRKRLGLQDMCIEFEVEEDLCIGSLEKLEYVDGFSKYSIRISKNPLNLDSEITIFSKEHQTGSSEKSEKIEVDKMTPVAKVKKEQNMEETLGKGVQKLAAKRGKKRKTVSRAVKRRKLDDTSEHEKNDNPEVEENEEQEEEMNDRMSELDDTVKTEGVPPSANKETSVDIVENLNEANEDDNATLNSTGKKPKKEKGNKKKKKKKDNENEQETKTEEKVDKKLETMDEEIEGAEDDTKPKRRYNKRQAYNRDDLNYTVRKSETGEKIYKCNYCGIEIKYHGNMKDHIRIHTKETPFVCDKCGKGFGNQSNYNHHLDVHRTDRPYECQLCHYSFKSKMAYKRHSRRHTGASTHTCDYCGRGFFSSTELLKHIVIHTGEKKHECEYCSRKFNNDSTLIRHRYLHTGGRHACHLCGAKFIRKGNFRIHLLKAHNSELHEDINTLPLRKRPKHMKPPTSVYLHQDDVPVVNNEIEIAAQEIQIIMTE